MAYDKEQWHEYYIKNKTKNQQYYIENKERIKEYYTINRERKLEISRNHYARTRNKKINQKNNDVQNMTHNFLMKWD